MSVLLATMLPNLQRRQRGAGSGAKASAKSNAKATKTKAQAAAGDDDGAPIAVPGKKSMTTKPLIKAGRIAILHDGSEWNSMSVTVVKVLSYDSVVVERPNGDGSGMDSKEVNPNTLEVQWDIGKDDNEDCPICLEEIVLGKKCTPVEEGRYARHVLLEPCERLTETHACCVAQTRATTVMKPMWQE